MKKILIHCPSNSEAGGAESLHQLSDTLSNYFDVYMSYYLDHSAETPKKFNIYKINKSNFFDDKDTFHVVPEITTKYFYKKIRKGKMIINWLSVDNYLGLKDRPRIKNILFYLYNYITSRKPLYKLKNLYHLSQSEYANLFLKKNNFKFTFIGDYTNQLYLDNSFSINKKKEDLVIYNPKKGYKYLEKIIINNKNKFIPIVNMSNDEIYNLMQKSKVYIDLGRLPGKDRIPREACAMKNIIILGKRGSGSNDIDFPIPNSFKIDLRNSNYIDTVNYLINDSIENYEAKIKLFENYKEKLILEKEIFYKNTKNFFDNIIYK